MKAPVRPLLTHSPVGGWGGCQGRQMGQLQGGKGQANLGSNQDVATTLSLSEPPFPYLQKGPQKLCGLHQTTKGNKEVQAVTRHAHRGHSHQQSSAVRWRSQQDSAQHILLIC